MSEQDRARGQGGVAVRRRSRTCVANARPGKLGNEKRGERESQSVSWRESRIVQLNVNC